MITVLLTCVKDSTMRKVKKVLRFGYNITTRSSKLQDPIAKKFQKISILLQIRLLSLLVSIPERGLSALHLCDVSCVVRYIGRRTGGNVPAGSQLFILFLKFFQKPAVYSTANSRLPFSVAADAISSAVQPLTSAIFCAI